MKSNMIRAVILMVIGSTLFSTTVFASPIAKEGTKIYEDVSRLNEIKELSEETEIDDFENFTTFIKTEKGYLNKENLYQEMYVTAKSGLNLRKEPNTKSKIIEAVPYNTKLKINFDSINEESDWYKGFNDEFEFYVHKDYLSLDKQKEIQITSTSSTNGNYLGNFKLTAYCACSTCCGKWAGYGITASGVVPSQGRTVAMGGIPFGTKLLINGNVYTVEDRGTPYGHVDVYFNNHSDALNFGLQYADVYVVN